jgi:hypothetical protein
MKKFLILFQVVLISVAFMSCVTSTETEKDAYKPGVIVANATVVTATVQAIDYHSRMVTIRGPQGKVIDLHADESVRNFDQVKIGDKVEAKILESVALYVQKHDGTQPSVKEGAAVALAPRGEKPGIAAADTVVITATVEKIDYETRMVTLKGPDGKSRTLRVHERAPDMEKVKVEDQVVVRYTVAVAITVDKPE